MTTTSQTPTGQVSVVTMVRADGGSAPSVINLPDSSSIKPNSDGSITVSAQFVDVLQRAGWFVKLSTGALPV